MAIVLCFASKGHCGALKVLRLQAAPSHWLAFLRRLVEGEIHHWLLSVAAHAAAAAADTIRGRESRKRVSRRRQLVSCWSESLREAPERESRSLFLQYIHLQCDCNSVRVIAAMRCWLKVKTPKDSSRHFCHLCTLLHTNTRQNASALKVSGQTQKWIP